MDRSSEPLYGTLLGSQIHRIRPSSPPLSSAQALHVRRRSPHQCSPWTPHPSSTSTRPCSSRARSSTLSSPSAATSTTGNAAETAPPSHVSTATPQSARSVLRPCASSRSLLHSLTYPVFIVIYGISATANGLVRGAYSSAWYVDHLNPRYRHPRHPNPNITCPLTRRLRLLSLVDRTLRVRDRRPRAEVGRLPFSTRRLLPPRRLTEANFSSFLFTRATSPETTRT